LGRNLVELLFRRRHKSVAHNPTALILAQIVRAGAREQSNRQTWDLADEQKLIEPEPTLPPSEIVVRCFAPCLILND
jgi:hypothetical protein